MLRRSLTVLAVLLVVGAGTAGGAEAKRFHAYVS
jgi:hypothetical protein